MNIRPSVDVDAELARIKRAREEREGRGQKTNGGANGKWPKPKSLPTGLAPVEAFSSEFLSAKLAPWIDDIANRLQCPPDYVAVAALTALGSVIGRRLGIKPQRKTDWVEVPNMWGLFIGRPGMLKSPAMMEALRPIHHLEAQAAKGNQTAQEKYEAEMAAFKLRKEVAIGLRKRSSGRASSISPDSSNLRRRRRPRSMSPSLKHRYRFAFAPMTRLMKAWASYSLPTRPAFWSSATRWCRC